VPTRAELSPPVVFADDEVVTQHGVAEDGDGVYSLLGRSRLSQRCVYMAGPPVLTDSLQKVRGRPLVIKWARASRAQQTARCL
jgi:hypothetical protein